MRKSSRPKLIDKRNVIGIVIPAILIFVALFIISSSGVTTSTVASLQTRSFSLISGDLSFIKPFITVFLGLIVLVSAYAVLAGYGVNVYNWKIGFAASVIAILLSGMFFNFSPAYMFMGFGLVISCSYVIPLSNTYFQELKRWKFFRSGSHSVSKGLLVFNMFIALGIFLTVSSNINYYNQEFAESLSEVIGNMTLSVAGQFAGESMDVDQCVDAVLANNNPPLTRQDLTAEQLLMIENECQNQISTYSSQVQEKTSEISDQILSNEMFASIMNWMPAIIALTVWIGLEFLRGLVFSNVAGLFSILTIRLFENIK